MNYKNLYSTIVEKASLRGLNKTKLDGYFEAHHIAPRCMGGSDDSYNLVLLTAREHYIAHLLLAKIYPESSGLHLAVILMTGRSKNLGYNKNSKLYAASKVKLAALYSGDNAPSFKDFTGQRFGRLTTIGLAGWRQRSRDGCHESRWLCECDCGEYIEVAGKNLQQGNTQSCGCLVKDSYPRVKSEDWKASRERDKAKDVGFKSGRSDWNCEKYDRPWKSPAIMKYPHNEDKWKNADYFYNCWETFGGKGLSMHLFHKMYKETHSDDIVVKNYFSLLVAMFNNGWAPVADLEWIQYTNHN